VILFPRLEMSNNISKPLAFGEHAVCITNTSIHSFGELVDHLQLSLFPFPLTKLSLIVYIRKYLNGLPFWHSAYQMGRLKPIDCVATKLQAHSIIRIGQEHKIKSSVWTLCQMTFFNLRCSLVATPYSPHFSYNLY
jgi:hypothetical protein